MCDVQLGDEEETNFIDRRLDGALEEKLAIVLVGGPGSGKSGGKLSTVESLHKTLQDFANIDPDEILTELFNNNNMCRGEVNVINDRSYEKAIEQGKNIIFDGTGKDFEWYSTNVLKKLKEHEYTVNLVIVMNDVENVLERITARAEREGREVPEEYTRSVYSILSEAIPKYLSLKCEYADSIYLYDNSRETIHFLYKTTCEDGIKKLMIQAGGKIPSSKNKKSRRRTNRKSKRKKSKRRTNRKSKKRKTKKRKSKKK
tara:strand:- start:204 stop:977 length:774 start_codon:yes stop_codon:yes gene_type:complete